MVTKMANNTSVSFIALLVLSESEGLYMPTHFQDRQENQIQVNNYTITLKLKICHLNHSFLANFSLAGLSIVRSCNCNS